MTQSNATVEVKKYLCFDPLCALVKVTDGNLEKGDYIAQIGQIDCIYDGEQEVATAECRDAPYTVRSQVSATMFIRFPVSLQFGMLNDRHDKLSHMIKVLGDKLKWCEANPDKTIDDYILERISPEGSILEKGGGMTLDKKKAQESAKRVKWGSPLMKTLTD